MFQGHNLVELYTKRQFRCDCGSNKLKSSCKLEPRKEGNTENKYNQNFSGLYCTCSRCVLVCSRVYVLTVYWCIAGCTDCVLCRPYPDQDDPVEDCMIQCVVCEDWYHGRHTGMGQGGPPDDRLVVG